MKRFLSAFLFLVAALPLLAQDAQVSGYVIDPSGAAIPNARVEVRNQATSASRSTMANEIGRYVVPFLKPGVYTISADANGFKRFEQTGVKLEVGQQASIDLKLQIGPTSEAITVSGGVPLVNTENAAVGTVVDRQFVENIPLNGRSFQSLITLTPGVVAVPAGTSLNQGQFSVNGQRASVSNQSRNVPFVSKVEMSPF
jgi:hypothetical protein